MVSYAHSLACTFPNFVALSSNHLLNLGLCNAETNTETDFKIYYDYNKENLGKLCNVLGENLITFDPITNEFCGFVEIFSKSVDDTSKLEKPKTLKRNHINNPWITPGLVNSINRKDKLYQAWKKSITCKNKIGNLQLY